MRKKLIAALCLILCVLLGAGIGYAIRDAGYHNQIKRLSSQHRFDLSNPPLIADAETASRLAETYYQSNFNQNGKDPRLAQSARYIPQIGTWTVLLMPEEYVLAMRESFSTVMMVGNSCSVTIQASDGTILSIEFGE